MQRRPFQHFLASDCIELANLIIAIFKTEWQYNFQNVSQVQPGGGGVDFFFGGGGLFFYHRCSDRMGFEDFSSPGPLKMPMVSQKIKNSINLDYKEVENKFLPQQQVEDFFSF